MSYRSFEIARNSASDLPPSFSADVENENRCDETAKGGTRQRSSRDDAGANNSRFSGCCRLLLSSITTLFFDDDQHGLQLETPPQAIVPAAKACTIGDIPLSATSTVVFTGSLHLTDTEMQFYDSKSAMVVVSQKYQDIFRVSQLVCPSLLITLGCGSLLLHCAGDLPKAAAITFALRCRMGAESEDKDDAVELHSHSSTSTRLPEQTQPEREKLLLRGTRPRIDYAAALAAIRGDPHPALGDYDGLLPAAESSTTSSAVSMSLQNVDQLRAGQYETFPAVSDVRTHMRHPEKNRDLLFDTNTRKAPSATLGLGASHRELGGSQERPSFSLSFRRTQTARASDGEDIFKIAQLESENEQLKEKLKKAEESVQQAQQQQQKRIAAAQEQISILTGNSLQSARSTRNIDFNQILQPVIGAAMAVTQAVQENARQKAKHVTFDVVATSQSNLAPAARSETMKDTKASRPPATAQSNNLQKDNKESNAGEVGGARSCGRSRITFA